jgi:hypothetical protein
MTQIAAFAANTSAINCEQCQCTFQEEVIAAMRQQLGIFLYAL